MNLNKKNFFNEIERSLPEVFYDFSRWIDEYKVNVEWELLFGSRKFHDIPFEMQEGVLKRYFRERLGELINIPLELVAAMSIITVAFVRLQAKLEMERYLRN